MNKKILIMTFIVIVVVGTVLAMTVFKNGEENGVAYKMEELDIGNIQAIVDTTGALNPVITGQKGSDHRQDRSRTF